jgi:hypothetical protein
MRALHLRRCFFQLTPTNFIYPDYPAPLTLSALANRSDERARRQSGCGLTSLSRTVAARQKQELVLPGSRAVRKATHSENQMNQNHRRQRPNHARHRLNQAAVQSTAG